MVAVQLMIVGVFIALGGLYLSLLELRGRSRLPGELAALASLPVVRRSPSRPPTW